MTLEEQRRLQDHGALWKKWGPYLSERQWGTVREDYSANGDAWNYFSHDQARARSYKWGEDGLAGYSDDHSRLCFAVALWNGQDPILKERLFGLTNSEGNHGEDVKEYYFYLDSTPTHSYMKYLYKYPQRAFPYGELIEFNRRRTRHDFEYELLDTGVFDDDRYFDVCVEYAKAAPDDTCIRISVANRGPGAAPITVLPQLWFRNTWWMHPHAEKPSLRAWNPNTIHARHPELGDLYLYVDGGSALLFTENESNNEKLFGTRNITSYVKDAFHEYVVNGRADRVNPAQTGTKSAAVLQATVPAHGAVQFRVRLSNVAPDALPDGGAFGAQFDDTFNARVAEADAFYAGITPEKVDADGANVMRQALAGMLWSKQHYYFDLDRWLEEHAAHPLLTPSARDVRNKNWFHMVNDDVISMPDKWEYPWFAAWDLAFHCGALSMVDVDFAKQQLDLLLRELYLHPNGQIPAYEWNFGDVNPPVHAWATLFVYNIEKEQRGEGDVAWLKHAFQKLLLNFTWWVNRKDPAGKNVFEGGFLGLDNIGIFDRSAPLPTGGFLEQADGTAWMALFAQNMLEIAGELARYDPMYEEMASKFVEHFFWIAGAMDRMGEHQDEMWDEQDGFFYDLLRLPNGDGMRLKVRSMVGLLPLCATTVFPADMRERMPRMFRRAITFINSHPQLMANIAPPRMSQVTGRNMLAIVNEDKLRRILARMLDENEFLSEYGIRALSQYYRDHPFVLSVHGEEYRVAYLPAESDTGMFGGNSNWRGPIWMPVNLLLIRALLQLYSYYGDEFKVECPTGSGAYMTLFEVANEIARRLVRIFTRNADGKRPVYGGAEKFQTDPHWRDYILFYEYFHGDNGAGLGASHQTGWTGLVARLIQSLGFIRREDILAQGARAAAIYSADA